MPCKTAVPTLLSGSVRCAPGSVGKSVLCASVRCALGSVGKSVLCASVRCAPGSVGKLWLLWKHRRINR